MRLSSPSRNGVVMADGVLTRVHFIDPETWRVTVGWLNVPAVAVVGAGCLDLRDVLCPDCLDRASHVPVLDVRLLDGSSLFVLGDGRHGDADAVRAARLALALRRVCEHHVGV